MNTHFLIFLLCLFLSSFMACGQHKSTQTDTSADSVKSSRKEPIALGNGREAKIDTVIATHQYHITLRCVADKKGEIVIDELQQQFYANRVEVSIIKDGKELLNHHFTKLDFLPYLTQKETNGTLLQGMSYYEELSNVSFLCLTATVGEPGLDGGKSFLVKVSTANGSFTISPDLKIIEKGMENEMV